MAGGGPPAVAGGGPTVPGVGWPCPGVLTIEKGNPVEMKGPGHDLMVPWSVRFTLSGDYYHAA